MSNNSHSASSKTRFDALVLDARLRQSLVTVRSLGSRGLRVAALETVKCLPVPAFSSRWCQEKVVSCADEGTKEYLDFLERVLDATDIRVLIASSDGTIALLRRYRERIERRVHIALAQEPALGIAINKERTLAIAKQLGLSIPRSVTIGSVSEVRAGLDEIGLPAVVKPVESWISCEQGGVRVASRLVTTLEETRCAVEELTCYGGREAIAQTVPRTVCNVLLQQFLPGRRESLSFFFAQGEIRARFAQWVKRIDPPLGGTAVLRQSIAMPLDTGEQAERLIAEIGLEGYSLVEFRRDDAGKAYLMEINARLTAGIEHAVRAGVDFPYLLYQWGNGDRFDGVKVYRVGSQMRYVAGDMMTTVASVKQRGRPGVMPPMKAILAFLLTFLKPMEYDYVDWRDPLPACTATMGFLRLMWGLGRSWIVGA